ncbi:MAG: hypothetical protein ACPGNT_10755, partial [Rhodospirillales bacterium]
MEGSQTPRRPRVVKSGRTRKGDDAASAVRVRDVTGAHRRGDSSSGPEQADLEHTHLSKALPPLAIPITHGEKTDGERFPGALNTYTIEAMMQD